MTDTDLDRLLTAADPFSEEELASFDFEAAERELRAEIRSETPSAAPVRRPATRRRRPFVRVAAVAGCLVLAAFAILLALGSLGGGGDGDGGSTAYAAEAIEIAEANRRLLVTEEGWDVYYAQFSGPYEGEVGFADERGRRTGAFLDMTWYGDAREIASRSRPVGDPIEIAGETGYFYRAYGSEFIAVLPGQRAHGRAPGPSAPIELGETGMLLKGVAESKAEFRERLESIVAVDVDAWLAAMPSSVVQPVDQEAEVEKLLEGVPLPAGFDPSSLEPEAMPQDRYQLTAYVLYGAYCSWLDEWWFAQKAGRQEDAAAALDQLRASPSWPAVREQAQSGALDNDFRLYVREIEAGGGDKQVYDQMMNCIEY